MFMVILTYKKPIEEIERALPEHVKFLDKYYKNKKFIFSGRRNPRVGGIIMINTESAEEALSIIREDPLYQFELADYETIEFIPTKYDERFSVFLNN